jgi:hypothetical protein
MTVESNHIIAFGFEEMQSCYRECSFPTTALFRPFADGTYTFEVIDIGGFSKGTVPVTIPGD